MHLRSLDHANISSYNLATFIAVASTLVIVARLLRPSKLDGIPTVGSSSQLGSWWAGLRYMSHALTFIQEGYKKHKRAPFKIPVFHRWMVLVGNREHVEELRKAPDDTLSFLHGINDELQVEYTMGRGIHHDPYHIPILRSQLTRSIGVVYPEIRNEIILAFDDVLGLCGNDWKGVLAHQGVLEVIFRTTNRLFVGAPLCRDRDWINLNLQFTQHVIKGAQIIKMFPVFLKPLVSRLFTKIAQSNEHGRKLLGPIIAERRRCMDKYGNKWADKPNDLLSWLMEEATEPESTIEALTARMLTLNFAAINTSAIAFTNALFQLAAHPEYVQPLREEVEAIVEKEGWSKAAVSKMQKVDGFLRESERVHGSNSVNLIRKVLKDYTFSDGTLVPKGTVIAAATRCIHYDEELYSDAHLFKPFRFVDTCDEDGEGPKHQFVSTAPEYLAFGHGRHACPGRFYAAAQLKSMLAHVVVTYDIKLEDNARLPESLPVGTWMIPDLNAKVLFRRRIA